MTLEITVFSVILWAIAAACFFFAIRILEEGEPFICFVALAMGIIIAWWGFHDADPQTAKERAEKEKARQEYEAREMQPRVIREVDGCKVYTFKSDGRYHYFTRCPGDHVVTDTSYEKCTGAGKTRSCKEVHDSIETK